MKSKHRIRLGHQFRLERGKVLDSRLKIHPGPLGCAPREIEVHLVVTGLGFVQTQKQVAQRRADGL